ncbi:MAG: phosphoenolpyruvate--protein phosphotransferase [Opitutales bacterium]|nr:phosphoenolpyruvate--protein phosphotransferase [Opitutales bacterium]
MSENPQEERTLTGIPASPGVAHGPAFVFLHSELDVPAYTIETDQFDHEIDRFEKALIATRKEIQKIRVEIADNLGEAEAQIFDAHQLVLEDKALIDETIRELRDTGFNIEHCFQAVAQRYIDFFDSIDDDYLKERASDIRDVARRLLHTLLGQAFDTMITFSEDRIFVAEDITPSDTANLDQGRVLGLITDKGGHTSHSVIMARSLGIPAVVGLHDATDQIDPGDDVIIDGYDGIVIIHPTAETLFKYGKLKDKRKSIVDTFSKTIPLPSQTADGREFILSANVESAQDIDLVNRNGARGIGLFRTEGIFLKSNSFPSEEEQYQDYRAVVEGAQGRMVTIRTLDLGGDKSLKHGVGIHHIHEENPFMGFRAIRFCLQYTNLFKEQLRAILRASAHGRVRIMYPMISGIEELKRANELLEDAKQDLEKRGEAYSKDLPVGTMIEIPSAAYTTDILAEHCSFFSIGTNDLIQYLMAADRLNDQIAHLYQPSHPAVLRTIRTIVDNAKKRNLNVSVCGEMAGDPLYTGLLMGLGIDELSITPALLPEVKYLVRTIHFDDTLALAKKAMDMDTAAEIRTELNNFRKERLKDLMDWE